MPNKYGWLNQIWGAVGYFVDGSGFHRITEPNTGPFPKVMLHEGVNGAGVPLLKPDPDDFRRQVVDVEVLDQIQRFGYWCIQPAYLWDDHAEVLREIRRAGTKVFAHLLVSPFWNVASSDRSSYQARIQDAVGVDYFRRPDGTPWQSPNFVPNITVPVVRAELIDIWTDVLGTGLFDGALIDPVCGGNGWRVTAADPLDYRAAGYASLEDWDGAMRGAQGAILSELRFRFPDLTMIGNGGPAGDYPGGDRVDGWWREKFPHQNPFNWFANMFSKLGLLKEPYQVSKRRLSIIAVNPLWTGRPMPDGNDAKEARFGLGSACLGESGFVWGPEGYNWKIAYRTWWLDQYSVDRTTGMPTRRATGWLGRAVKAAYEIPQQVYVREFQYGAVLVNGDGWPKEVATPWPAYLIGGAGPVTRVTVPARDAVYLLRE
jgi:hypothetical protein